MTHDALVIFLTGTVYFVGWLGRLAIKRHLASRDSLAERVERLENRVDNIYVDDNAKNRKGSRNSQHGRGSGMDDA